MGNKGKVSAALVKAVTGPRSKLRNRMIPFLNSPLVTVTIQNKFVILQLAAGEGSLCGYLRLARSLEGTGTARTRSRLERHSTRRKLRYFSETPTRSSSSGSLPVRAPSTH